MDREKTIERLTKELQSKDRKIKRLDKLTDYYIGEEYCKGLMEDGYKKAIKDSIEITKKHKHTSNYSVNGQIVSVDSVQEEELLKLGKFPQL